VINELKIGSDRRKLVARMETEATQTRGPGCEELWFDDWKWFKVYRGEPELIEREVPFYVAWDFFLGNRRNENTQISYSNWIDELAFCQTFQELPLIFTVPSDITFHPAGWTLIESDEYGQGYEYIEGIPRWTYSSFVFSKDGVYIEIRQGTHWEAPGPCNATIQKFESY